MPVSVSAVGIGKYLDVPNKSIIVWEAVSFLIPYFIFVILIGFDGSDRGDGVLGVRQRPVQSMHLGWSVRRKEREKSEKHWG